MGSRRKLPIPSHLARRSKRAPKFCREAIIWKNLRHPNVLPLLGVTFNPPQLVSVWMPGGNLTEYIKKDPGADRCRLVCFPLDAEIKSSLTDSYTISPRVWNTFTSTMLFTGTSRGCINSRKCYPNILIDVLVKHLR